jgi:hypothetical protein
MPRFKRHCGDSSNTVVVKWTPRKCQPIPPGMHIPWSQNMVKTQRRIARLQARIAQSRANARHQLTPMLVTRFDVIAIEDLNVDGMLKSHPLARAMADMG